jgi:hypothetical protein
MSPQITSAPLDDAPSTAGRHVPEGPSRRLTVARSIGLTDGGLGGGVVERWLACPFGAVLDMSISRSGRSAANCSALPVKIAM